MSDTNSAASDIEQLKQDLNSLKTDVANLVAHLTSSAASGVGAAVNRIDQGTQTLYRHASVEGERAVRAVSGQVEQQPLVAVAIAMGLGYLSGRGLCGNRAEQPRDSRRRP